MTDHPQMEQIEALAATKLNMRLGVRKELRKLTDILGEGEQVLNLARGQYDGKTGLVVVTDRRLLFTEQGMMRARLEDFPYDKISSVQTETGMIRGKLTIFVSGSRGEIEDVAPKERVREIGDYVRGRIGAGSGTPEPRAAAPDGLVEQIAKLGELRDAGVLTAEEFEAKKTELLSRI